MNYQRKSRVIKLFLVFGLWSLVFGLPTVFCEEEILPVVIDGDEISYAQGESKVKVCGNVKMKYQGTELFCDRADYDANTHIANLSGNIRIVRDGSTIYGDNVLYNFNTNKAQMLGTEMEFPPLYAKANEVQRIGDDKYILKRGHITTCSAEKPHYRMTAKRVVAFPGKKIIAKNMVLKLGKIPLFYIPYCVMPLNDNSFPFEISPGKESDWGNYMLTRWRYHINDEHRGKVHLDFYEDRGIGQGISHKMESKNFGEALINYYYLDDEMYRSNKRNDLFKIYPGRAAVSDKYLEDDRYKAQGAYCWQISPKMSITSEFNKFSDEYFIKDFFYREYEVQPHPLSYGLIDYSFSNSSLSLLGQKRMNRFWSETEYLPQLEYDFYKQNLGNSSFYFESNTAVGNLSYKTANSDVDHDAMRAHSHNTLSYAKKVGWLYFNPYIGNYTTFYSKDSSSRENVTRTTPAAGASLSTKLYKTFRVDGNILGKTVDSMRHVLTPTLQYDYIHQPTIPNSDLFQFDGTDNLVRKESVIFKLDNKLQAKSQEEIWTFLYFSPAVEYAIHEEGKGSYFKNIKADLEIYPRAGLALNSDTEYDFSLGAFRGVNVDLTLSDPEENKYSISLGQRYTRSDSSQSTLGLEYQLTPKVRFTNYIRYENTDRRFKEQQYALRTDLHCWWMDVGLDVDEKENKDRKFTFWLVFTLKDFPDLHLGFDHSYEGARKDY
ncbi:MAG: LPS-assembly protein LptD [Candidatus Omnitrophica bacterium]|nr:LPS-assembly protein LptD [Candidatus Omnitrophota bacterium]